MTGARNLLTSGLVLVSCAVAWGQTAAASKKPPTTLPAADRPAYEALKSKKLHEIGEHRQLAEYMRLRKLDLGDKLPDPADETVHYALKSLGQEYQLKAWRGDLSHGDCVTWTERCIALGCTDTWEAAYKLHNRLRYKDGSGELRDQNRESALDWIPNNSWLYEEITDQLEAPLSSFVLHFENRDVLTTYVGKEHLETIAPHLRSGDLLFLIADRRMPPSDAEMRTRCLHIAIVYKPTGDRNIQILQSFPPAASQWPVGVMFQNRYIRGAKFLRLRDNARELVAGELARLGNRFDATPAQLDNESRVRKGKFAFVTPAREPDQYATIDGINYGIFELRAGETLYGLTKGAWKGISSLELNRPLMTRSPDLKAEEYQGQRLYVPLSRANGDTTPPGEP